MKCDKACGAGRPMRVALFTNNYLPFCGGVTISVETLRPGSQPAGTAWVFARAARRRRRRPASCATRRSRRRPIRASRCPYPCSPRLARRGARWASTSSTPSTRSCSA